jgi:hypothetical protein
MLSYRPAFLLLDLIGFAIVRGRPTGLELCPTGEGFRRALKPFVWRGLASQLFLVDGV